MRAIPFIGYLKRLINQSHKYQYTKISTGDVCKPKFIFGLYKWIFIGIALSFSLFVGNLKSDILNSLITAFSILVGLLANLLMTVYNMAQTLSAEPQETLLQKKIFLKKTRFFKQFGYLTTYAILLSMICIILSILNQCPTSAISTVSELFYYKYSFETQDILSAFDVLAFGGAKALLVYFVLDSLYIVLFAVSSFIDYLNGEITDMEE